METQDIIQEFAQQTTQDSSLEKDIIKEYAESIKPEAEPEGTVETTEPTEVISEQPIETLEPTETIETVVEDDVLDEEDFIKTKTGGRYSSWEEVEEALEKEKSNIEFENETSLAIYNMLAEGKINEVADILQKKMFVETLENKSEEEVLKAYIKANNPEFDSSEVEDEFNEKYTIDEFSFDDNKLKREQKKLLQRIKGDVTEAKQFFGKLAEDIKFPQYTPPQVAQYEPETDEAVAQERQMFLQSLENIEKSVNSLPFNWKDEKTNLSVTGKFEIPAQELQAYKSGAENLEEYHINRYYKEGKYMGDKLVRDLYIQENFDKILSSAISQAVNQTRLTLMKQAKNISVDTEQSSTYKPADANEESSLLENLFMGHLKR
jgi:hypothetical protein